MDKHHQDHKTPSKEYKIVMVGCRNSGLSSLYNRIVKDAFSKEVQQQGIRSDKIHFKDGKYNAVLFDIAGPERLPHITEETLKGTSVVVIVFDVTNRKTFEQCSYLYNEALKVVDTEEVEFVLFGTKNDLPNREVEYDEGEKFAMQRGMFYFDGSAAEGNSTSLKNHLEEVLDKIYKKDHPTHQAPDKKKNHCALV